MKASIVKRMLAGALAVSLVMAPAMVQAAEVSSDTGNSTTAAESIISSSTSESVTSVAKVPTTSEVGGVKSTMTGVYLATKVNGSAVTSNLATIAQGYGLNSNEKPYAKFFNLDAKKSPMAMQVIDTVASSLGATVGPVLNIELGKMAGGEYSLLASDGPAIRIAIGIPKNFVQGDSNYAMICVREGGAFSVLKDLDSDSATITFDAAGGAGAYGIIRY